MEQLINTATPYYYAELVFFIIGLGIVGVAIFIFLGATAIKEAFIILILGALFFIPTFHFSNICNKYNERITAIVKPVISESFPNATDFSYFLDVGSFTTNDIEYKIRYKKTVKNEEKLIISVKKQSDDNKDKQTKTLNIPKATSKQ